MEPQREREPGPDAARILIVDDHEDNIELLRARLEAWGYATDSAADGAEALGKVEESPPDLILLDVMMPKIDGIEVCQRLKADTSLPFMPIIMVTARADSKDIVAGLNAGADEYLVIPYDPIVLESKVERLASAVTQTV